MTTISLSELLRCVQTVVRAEMADTYWVRAEVSNISARPGGHCYMELAETEPGSRELFRAKIRANCWRNTWSIVSAVFQEATGQALCAGMAVLVEVSIDFHPVYGMSLVIEQIDPTFTLGDMARQKQETLRRLEQEGILDMQQLLPFPTLPRRVAVISSNTAAGYQDFQHQLLHNAYGFAFRTALFPATMQGDQASASIVAALDTICRESEHFDVVVIIRGGGATTDLSCFDRYEVASACAQFPLPIITGIGHTRDVSVVDRVAHISVKTPTAAAELLISKMKEQWELLQNLQERLLRTADQQVNLRRNMLDRLQMRLQMSHANLLQRRHIALDLIEKTISLHSPERIFRQGYSLTTLHGHVVRDASELHPGDEIVTHFAQGQIGSKVQ